LKQRINKFTDRNPQFTEKGLLNASLPLFIETEDSSFDEILEMNNLQNNTERRNSGDGKNQWIGIIFLVLGGVFLLRYLGLGFPSWVFSWKIILISIGVLIGLKDGFRGPSWLILVGIGSFFLLDDIFPDLDINRLIIPLVLLGIGLMLVFRPKSLLNSNRSSKETEEGIPDYDSSGNVVSSGSSQKSANEGLFTSDSSTDNELNVVSIFANVRKNILTKNFKGGEIVCIFGGAEINLNNADIPQTVKIEAVNIFGGTKLYVPNNWEIKSEVAAIFGGVEDKRRFPSITVVPDRTLILKGFCMFGGLEIKSY
jgi:predicted membrane protein